MNSNTVIMEINYIKTGNGEKRMRTARMDEIEGTGHFKPLTGSDGIYERQFYYEPQIIELSGPVAELMGRDRYYKKCK